MEKTKTVTTEVKVSKITLQVGGKTVELTVDEAKKLRDSLNNLFQDKIIYEKYPYLETYPVPLPAYPTGPYPSGPGDYPLPQTWCCNENNWTLKTPQVEAITVSNSVKSIVTFLILTLCLGCQTRKQSKTDSSVILSVKVPDSPKNVPVKLIREFNSLEYHKAQKALSFIEKLIPDLTYTNLPTLFWMDSKVFDGLTITPRVGPKYILIDKEFQFNEQDFKRNNFNYFKFGAILAHEVIGHGERGLNEPEVKKLVDDRLLNILFFNPSAIEKTDIP